MSDHSLLDDADALVAELEARCCDPGRSPRMAELTATLAALRTALARDGDPAALAGALDVIEDAGAQVGRLQVGCCAPDRMPRYARLLEILTATRADVVARSTSRRG